MTEFVWVPDPLGILYLHAAAVQLNGHALLFLGASGAGKSTICGLLSGFAAPLADDRVHAIPRPGNRWSIAGADDRRPAVPLSQAQAGALRGTPLGAVFSLQQEPEPRLERIHPLKTCRHLVDAFFDVHWHRRGTLEAKRSIFKRLAGIARAVPGYSLHFEQSGRTADMMREQFGYAFPAHLAKE